MSGDEMSVLFHDPHDLIDALEGRTVNACDDGCEARGVLRRVTQRGEERDVGPGWSSPTIYMVDIVTPETGDLICRTDVRNYDLLEVVPMSIPAPSTDGAPEPEEDPSRYAALSFALRDRMLDYGAFVPEDRHKPIGKWGLTIDDVIGLDRMLAAAGLRVVPEDRPAQDDPYHDPDWDLEASAIPAIVPVGFAAAPDDDTRREVETLIREIQQSRYHFGYVAHTKTLDAIERLLAAYLGGTDGR